jgi:hypothetical protein
MKLTPILAALAIALPAITSANHAPGSTMFTVKLENVSTPSTLTLSTGGTAPAPNSPGFFLVTRGSTPVFTTGKLDKGKGLEAQAEDGNPDVLAASYRSLKDVLASGVFNVPVGDAKPGPAPPGKSYQFTFEAGPGARLHFTTMFGQSNDAFFSPGEAGIALFDAKGAAVSGDVTSQVLLWDAGTEVNQEPGVGADQAPRQARPNTGASERQPVAPLHDQFTWPAVSQVLRVTITADQMAVSK